ncbi:MAG: ABC transporter permease subunit [Acetobacteraceae bacterium]
MVIAKAALIPVTLNTFSGVRAIPLTYREVARALGFTRWQTLTRLVLPGAHSADLHRIRYGLTHAWLALIAVELLASSEGLGYLLVYGRQMFWLDTVVMAMVLIGVIGFVLDYGLALAERRLQRWRVAGVAVGHAP